MQRFPKLTAQREACAYRYLDRMQRLGLEPFALAWIYDQVAGRFTLLVIAMPDGAYKIDDTGRYRTAVRTIFAHDRDAPVDILAIDDQHPWVTGLRRAVTLLRQPNGKLHALKMGHYILMPSWIYHVQTAHRTSPPKWRWERVEHALAA